MSKKNLTIDKIFDDGEVNLVHLIKYIWERRLFLFLTSISIVVIGLLVSFLSPANYEAKTVFVVQEENTSSLGNLSGLASMAGVDLGSNNSNSSISMVLYPQIIKSSLFQRELMNSYITFNGDSITLFDYKTKYMQDSFVDKLYKYSIGLPSLLVGNVENKEKIYSNNNVVSLSLDEYKTSSWLSQIIDIEIDDDDGCATITATLPTPLMAAQVVNNYFDILQNNIIRFKTRKSVCNLKLIEERYYEKKAICEKLQLDLANFKDRNVNFSTAVSRIKESNLNNEYALIFGIYSELGKQLEKAKLKVENDTPIFTVLTPVTLPIHKTNMSKLMVLILSSMIGFVLGIFILLGNIVIKSFIDKWNN